MEILQSKDTTPDPGRRCAWATGDFLTPYHDLEWGVPVHDDRRHFELLSLEGAQAGLSWLSVLKRRPAYRQAFLNFDPAMVAEMDHDTIESLLLNPALIRNRRKLESVPENARRFLGLQEEFGSFDRFIWDLAGGQPVVNRWPTAAMVPPRTPLSDRMSEELRRRGFSFVGPTICYAHLQSSGVVMDHTRNCFRWPALAGGSAL